MNDDKELGWFGKTVAWILFLIWLGCLLAYVPGLWLLGIIAIAVML